MLSVRLYLIMIPRGERLHGDMPYHFKRSFNR